MRSFDGFLVNLSGGSWLPAGGAESAAYRCKNRPIQIVVSRTQAVDTSLHFVLRKYLGTTCSVFVVYKSLILVLLQPLTSRKTTWLLGAAKLLSFRD
jgi:hypothetical protein